MKAVINFTLATVWVSGIVLAKGFWSTLAAVFIPFWGWYLVVEALWLKTGML